MKSRKKGLEKTEGKGENTDEQQCFLPNLIEKSSFLSNIEFVHSTYFQFSQGQDFAVWCSSFCEFR